MIAILNFVAKTCFLKAICCGIFEYLLTASSKKRRLFGSISNYFGIIKTNSQRILQLYYFAWFCDVFHIFHLCNKLQADFEYATWIIVFINYISKSFIKPENKAKVS